MKMVFAAVHESASGTTPKCCEALRISGFRG